MAFGRPDNPAHTRWSSRAHTKNVLRGGALIKGTIEISAPVPCSSLRVQLIHQRVSGSVRRPPNSDRGEILREVMHKQAPQPE